MGPGGASIYLISAIASLVSENTIAASTAQGILVRSTKGAKLFDNVVQGSSSHGIHLDPSAVDTLVLNNVAAGNGFGLPGGHGLFVEGDRNLVERNTLNGNSGYGLFFTGAAATNTFGRNMARGNAAYAHELTDDQHRKLLTFLRGLLGAVVLSGYRCALYDELLPDWRRVDKATHADGARDRIESLWLSPNITPASMSMFDMEQTAFDEDTRSRRWTRNYTHTGAIRT